jgi:2-polyprenyl-3-methyl-5-hydroxy-6-metoxy-1,4-benzoquinol methylase
MSALFSKYLIENYIKGFSPIEGERLKKIEDISHGILNKSLSGVFHKVDAKDYSEFAGNNLINFLETKFIDKKTFFTVFAITPHQFYDLILSEYQKAKNISHTEEIEINDLFDFVKTKYPHFIIFNQNCDGKLLSNTVRILIMNENYPYRSDIRTLDEWKLFKLCNGNIPCWVIRRADLENTFVKDFAIIGDKILLDWDSKGEILTIIDIDMNTSLKPILIRLKETFYKFKLKIGISNAIFIWIDEFDNQIKKLFNYRNSHLFPAFRFANYLPSIVEQRKNQKQILNQYLPESALFIGCGYGDELDTILNSNSFASNCRKIQAIDIAKDVQAHFYLQPEINGLKTKVEYQNINLFELPRDNEPNSWECIQCGFVLEDIHYDDKEDAIERIHKVLNHNGILIISEIFLDNDSNNDNERGTQRVKEVETFYNLVLDEAQHVGINTEFEKGIKRACKNAKLGIRDYFETQKQIKNRLIDKKRFKIIQTIPNSKNRFMGIILAQKI